MRPEDELESLAADEQQRIAERDRAHRAARMLEDDLFVGAVEAVKDDLWQSFAGSELDDDVRRKNARIGLDLLDKIIAGLRSHMETGKMAESQLAEIEKKRKRLALFRRSAA